MPTWIVRQVLDTNIFETARTGTETCQFLFFRNKEGKCLPLVMSYILQEAFDKTDPNGLHG